MNEKNLNKKIEKATKWSTITELLAKLIVPITNLILARILAPDAFGILATVTMVTSFADMLTDAGFQRYLIQHEFDTKKELFKNANVAFYTNLSISMLMWIVIVIFRNEIASLLGNSGLGLALVIASIQLPLTALSSIQMAVYKRNFDFKALFFRRLIAVLLPFFVTIPLALLGFDYWSLIIGTLSGQMVNVIILTKYSEWKPKFFYSFGLLREMFSFSMWTLLDSLIIWMGSYIDVFIIGSAFNSHLLGIYNNSNNMVNAIMNVVKSSITPVLLSGLSRYQNDNIEYKKLLFKFQRLMAFLIIPMGMGIFMYRDVITELMFGKAWGEATDVVGVLAITSSFLILLSQTVSICYVSKGKPKLSIIAQTLYLVPLIPISIVASKCGFYQYVYIRNAFKFELLIVNLIILQKCLKISASELLKNLTKPFLASCIMCVLAYFLRKVSSNMIFDFFGIGCCVIVYFVILYIIDRENFLNIMKKFLKKGRKDEKYEINKKSVL